MCNTEHLHDMNYEDEQERLRRLWEEIEIDEEPNDNEDELASEIDFTEERNTDSESEQDCDEEDDIENVAPPNKPSDYPFPKSPKDIAA
ncbi:hypothetical protein JTB14_015165 [Gonioctena quinquepunctata]|nr:hypothetical protein JTB14_015165 [Gonioctena quinquepunctata]